MTLTGYLRPQGSRGARKPLFIEDSSGPRHGQTSVPGKASARVPLGPHPRAAPSHACAPHRDLRAPLNWDWGLEGGTREQGMKGPEGAGGTHMLT